MSKKSTSVSGGESNRIADALERIADALESRNASMEALASQEGELQEEQFIEVPSEIKFATAEELASKLIAFSKKEFPNEEKIWIRSISQLYWGQKQINKWEMPPDIQLKIEKAEMLAQGQLDQEKETEQKIQLEKEKAALPSLVGSCVDWAKEHGIKRITQADVDAFLMEKDLEVLKQTKKSLYATANVAMKSIN